MSLALLVANLAVLSATADFVERGVFDGVQVSARSVPGSAFTELRFVAVATRGVDALCDAAYGPSDPQPYLVSREVLREARDHRVTYERIAPPLVSKRDYVLHSARKRSGPNLCRVDFASVDDAPTREGWVRLKRLAGSFVFEALRDGTVRVEHRIHMDPGGLLTPMLVEPTRQQIGLEFMRNLLGGSRR